MTSATSFPKAVIQAVASDAQQLGWFDSVETNEPKSAPAADMHYAVWAMSVDPAKRSGLIATSMRIELAGVVYVNMLRDPQGDIDADMMAAGWDLMARYSGAFTLGGLVREVDLEGEEGAPLAIKFGYVSIDKKLFRIAALTIPLICDDVFDQGA